MSPVRDSAGSDGDDPPVLFYSFRGQSSGGPAGEWNDGLSVSVNLTGSDSEPDSDSDSSDLAPLAAGINSGITISTSSSGAGNPSISTAVDLIEEPNAVVATTGSEAAEASDDDSSVVDSSDSTDSETDAARTLSSDLGLLLDADL